MKRQEEANEITFLSYNFWKQTYDNNIQHRLWARMKQVMYNKYIVNIDKMSIDIEQKANILKTEYEKEINKLIKFYNKTDFICACIALKEYFVKHLTKLEEKLPFIDNEQDCILNMINLALNINNTEFENNSFNKIVDTHSYFIDIIAITRLYVFLCENISKIEFFKGEQLSLNDVAFEQIETEAFNEYYDEFKSMGDFLRPEDYMFRNQGIIAKLERDVKNKEDILKESNKIVEPIVGFNINTLDMLSSFFVKGIFNDVNEIKNAIENDDNVIPIFAINKLEFIQLVKSFISKNELMKIIETFEIKLEERFNSEMQKHKIELTSFYQDEKYIYFGLIDLCQKFEMFKKLLLSGNYINMWIDSEKIEERLQDSQKKLSTYLCYTLADVLVSNGYKMHTEIFKFNGKRYEIPTVEEHNIILNGINITDKCGDYDLIFLDDYKNQIICIEFKYFKPSMTYKQLVKTDKNKFIKQVLGKKNDAQKILTREKIVKDNLRFFIEYLNGDSTKKNYSVKSIVVTARPNLFVFSDEINNYDLSLETYTINTFKKLVEERNI